MRTPSLVISVVGSGAIGGYYGARLCKAGHLVRFLMRRDFEAVRAKGLTVCSHHGDFHLDSVHAYRSTDEMGPSDLVLIAVKTTANHVLPTLLKPLMHPGTILMTMQNGLGNEAFLHGHFPRHVIMGCLCFTCIHRAEPGVIIHSDHGLVTLGAWNDEAVPHLDAICSLFRQSGIPCATTDDLLEARWRKLVWNIPFNGLSIAAGGKNVKNLLADGHLRRLVKDLMMEVIATAQALQLNIPYDFADENIQASESMGPYLPSSYLDFRDNRAVEVESIWGEPYRTSLTTGHEAIRIGMLYTLLRQLCKTTA